MTVANYCETCYMRYSFILILICHPQLSEEYGRISDVETLGEELFKAS